jgi:hypothetical protein|tara:strand:+ start:2536 stop:3774 length:1239 start_codon:yes stop_codon:yes gene_type:complete
MNQGIANTIFSFFALFLKSLSTLFLPFIVSNILGTDYFSDFSYFIILGSLVLVFCEYGSIYWLPNTIKKGDHDFKTQFSSDTFLEALNIRIIFFVLSAIICFILVAFKKLSFIDCILVLAIIQYSFFSLFYFSFRSYGFFKHELFLSLIVEILAFVVPIVCLLFFRDYNFFVLTFFGTRLVLIFFIFLYFRLTPLFSIEDAVKTLSLRYSYFFQVAASSLVLYIDTFFVKYFYPSELYLHQGFLRLSILFCLFVPVANSILLYYMRSNYLVSLKQYYIFLKKLLVFIVPILLIYTVFSFMTFHLFVDFMLGDKYSILHSYSFEFSILILLKYLSTIFGLNLTIIGFQNLRAQILFLVCILGAILYYFGLKELDFSNIFILIVSFNAFIFLCYFISYLKYNVRSSLLSNKYVK